MKYASVLLLLASTSAFAQVEIQEPWSRATPPGAKVAVGYMTIRNRSAVPDRLLGGSSPLAARVEAHTMEMKGDVMRMREAKGFEVPANGSFELKPNGAHLMLVDIKRPLKEGERVPLTLKFEKAGEVKTELSVQSMGAAKPHGH
jgi:copper(I)-binding protein